jgi:hypothetical protein
MNKRYNFKTQKGILEHCADLGHEILPCRDLSEQFPFAVVGMPATFHIGGDSYADEVVRVVYKRDGTFKHLVTKRGTFVKKVSANCVSKFDGGWWHETFLDSLKGSGWVELGVAKTHLDPSF